MGGSLLADEVMTISKIKPLKHFVETGTYKAESATLASYVFEHVHTIEIHEGLYKDNIEKSRDMGITNIHFYHGDSEVILPDIMEEVASEGAVFFLDAHMSGPDSGWNGVKHVPLIPELETILEYKPVGSVFVFDDVRLWGIYSWTEITFDNILKLMKKYGQVVERHYVKNDRFYVVTE
jgi:hypothetical protein